MEQGSSGAVDAAIDFDQSGRTALHYQLAQASDFIQAVLDELLCAEARVHGHEHHHIDVVNDLLERRDGRRGIQRHGGAHAGLVNLLDGAVEMDARLLMHVHDGCSKVAHLRDELLGLHNHQVHVKRLRGHTSHVFEHGKSERDVGNKDTVHDIQVQPVGLGAVEPLHLGLQVGKVGCQ